jgi:ATP-dependent protease HslVU (ClpYQ) peptidase subunit
MNATKRFAELKRKAETARSRRDRAEGSLEGVRRDLQKEFGAGTVKEAGELLKRLEKKLKKQEAVLESALAEYEKEWEDDG